MKELKLVSSMSVVVVGCIAGVQLVILTDNVVWFIVNVVTAISGGILLGDVLSEGTA